MKNISMLTPALLICTVCILGGCDSSDEDQEVVSSHSYKGHENGFDMNRFVNAYKDTLGTRLDDCQTCHTGGIFSYVSGGKTRTATKNACDFCHLIQHPDSTFLEAQPTTFAQTLNAYGRAYLNAGRNQAALDAIAGSDSDGDGADDADEIHDLKYPGDPASKPGQQLAPMKRFTFEQLEAMPAHSQFMLANASKQRHDEYATYRGVKIRDLLAAAGVDPADTNIAGVTVAAPDGFLEDIPASKLNAPYPAGLYYAALDTTTKGPLCGFVNYPDTLPEGLIDGADIPGEQWLMLAYERDGEPMAPSTLDSKSGKINGEGPLRLIVPQSKPGKPDRGSQYSPTQCGDGYDNDEAKDHNAGDWVRGAIIVRVNPLPAGTEDFDYRNGGWAYIDEPSVLVYGYGITAGN